MTTNAPGLHTIRPDIRRHSAWTGQTPRRLESRERGVRESPCSLTKSSWKY